MFMAGTSNGACGHGQAGPGVSVSGSCAPRKFSEKIALLTQRQAEDTAAFQEVMMDITSTRLQVQRERQARDLGPYFGGSLPNVNQIGRNPAELQGQPTCGPDAGCSARRHPIGERNQGDGRVCFPLRPIRRHTNSPYRSAHLSPPPDPSWRRNWSNSCPVDKSPYLQPPIAALNRTNSDSALHTTVRNTHTGGHLSPTHTLSARNRHSVFPYPVPPIEENVLEEGKLSRCNKKPPNLPSGHKCNEIPGINVLPSPQHPLSNSLLNIPSALSASGSLPDLSSLHLPSPQPPADHQDNEEVPASSLGRRTDLGAPEEQFDLPGLSLSLQGSLSNPLLPSSLSNPNIQSSLSSHSLPGSLSSASLNLSLSNHSLQSSPSNQSLQSFHSNSSLSSQSMQSAASLCSYSSGIGGSRSCSSSSLCGSPHQTSQSQVSLARRRAPLSPLVVPMGGESRWHQAKQFSPVSSPTLSSITQGVLLNTQLPKEPRPHGYSHNLSVHPQLSPIYPQQESHLQPKSQFLAQSQTVCPPQLEPDPARSCPQIKPDPAGHVSHAQVECLLNSQPPPQYAGFPPQNQAQPEGPQHRERKPSQQQQQQQQYLKNQRQQQQRDVELKLPPPPQDPHTKRQAIQSGGPKQPLDNLRLHQQEAKPEQDARQNQLQHKHSEEEEKTQQHVSILSQVSQHQQQQQQQQRHQQRHTQPSQDPQQQNGHQQRVQAQEHSVQPAKSHQQQQDRPSHGQSPQLQHLQDGRHQRPAPLPHPQEHQLQQYHPHQQAPYHRQQRPQPNQLSQCFPLAGYDQMSPASNGPGHAYSNQQPPQMYQHPQQPHVNQRDRLVHSGFQFQQFPLCQQQQIPGDGQYQQYQVCQQQQQSQDGSQFQKYQLCQQQEAQQCPQDGRQFLPQHGCQFQQQHPSQQFWQNHQLPGCNQSSLQSLDVQNQNSSATSMQETETRQELMRRQYQSQQGKTWAQLKLQGHKKRNQLIGSSLDSEQNHSNDSQNVLEPLQQQSYIGLHLTAHQTEALTQQLGQLSKAPVWGEGTPQPPVPPCGGDQGVPISQQAQNPAALHASLGMGYEDLSCLSMYGFHSPSEPFSLDDVTLNIDPLGLEELSMLADGHVVEDT